MTRHLLTFVICCLLTIAAGCQQQQTLSPEDFLYAYRCGSLPNQPGSGKGSALYEGKDQTYHYISRNLSPAEQFVENPMMTSRCRCAINLLPEDFPDGFVQTTSESFEAGEDTRQYVAEYLSRHKKPVHAPPPRVVENIPMDKPFKEPADPTAQELDGN